MKTKISFQLRPADNSWDEELQYDFAEWLRRTKMVERSDEHSWSVPSPIGYFDLLHRVQAVNIKLMDQISSCRLIW